MITKQTKHRELIEALSKMNAIGVSKRDTIEDVEEYVTSFSGSELLAAATVYGMTINTIASIAKKVLNEDR